MIGMRSLKPVERYSGESITLQAVELSFFFVSHVPKKNWSKSAA